MHVRLNWFCQPAVKKIVPSKNDWAKLYLIFSNVFINLLEKLERKRLTDGLDTNI